MGGQLFVDSHCHLDQYADPDTILREARQHRVVVVAVTESPSDFQRQNVHFGADPFLRSALGLHPLRAARLSGSEVERFFSSLGQTDYVGEVGIDGSRQGKPTERRQAELFDRVLADPRVKEKVLTVHSRGAEKQVVDRMENASVRGILHWYTGSLSVAERALVAGLYFSVNPSMTRSKGGRRLLQLLPPDRVITETDGPYSRVGSRPSRPIDVSLVVEALSVVWGIPSTEAAQVIIQNLGRLYSERASSAR